MWQLLGWAVCLAVLYYAFAFVSRPYIRTPLDDIPGPESSHFFFGNTLELLPPPPLSQLLNWAKEYAGEPMICYRFLWNEQRVLITDPAAIRHVLVSNARNYSKEVEGYNLLRLALGNGLITQDHETHAVHRKLIGPAFKRAVLKQLVSKFEEQADVMLDYLHREKGPELDSAGEEGVTWDLSELLNKITLNIIGDAGFGVSFDAFEDPALGTLGQRLYNAFSHIITEHTVLNSFIPIARYLPTPRNLSTGKNIVLLHRTVLYVVKEKRARLRDGTEGLPYADILDILIAAKDEETGFRLTDSQLAAHVKTFLGAGHETTSTLLMWTLYALSQEPEIEQRLVDEVRAMTADGKRLEFATIENLSYMSRVLKEVLRLYAPVGIIGRRAEEADVIAGFRIPKHTKVLVSPYVLHHMPSLWKDVEQFDPDRWTPERMQELHSCQYLPFILGPRDCVGKRFALLEAKVILTKLLCSYQFSMSRAAFDQMETRLHVTMRPHPTLQMRVKRRDQ